MRRHGETLHEEVQEINRKQAAHSPSMLSYSSEINLQALKHEA